MEKKIKRFLLVYGVVILGSIIFLIYTFVFKSRQILDVSWSKVGMENIEENEYVYDLEELLKMGIDRKQAENILKHPEKYRRVYITFEFNNQSNTVGMQIMEIKSQLSKEAKNRLIWMDNQLAVTNYFAPLDKRDQGVDAIFKLEGNDTEQKLMEMIKQTRFILTAAKLGTLFEHDHYPISVNYGGK